MAYYDETVQRDEGMVTEPDNRLRRPSRISSFSADGNGNFSRTESLGGATARQEWGADYDGAQNPVYAGMRQLANRENAIKAHNDGLMRDSILSGWKIARGNGGRLQQNTLGEFSRNLGMDGKTQAVVGAGLAKNGDFVLNVATKGQDGRVSLTPRVITKRQMYAMGCSGDGSIVNEGDLSALGNELTSSGYSANSLEKIPNWTQQRQARQAQASQKDAAATLQAITQYAQRMKRQGKSAEEFIVDVVNSKNGLPFFSNSGEQMYEDEDGNPVENPFEEDGKTLKSGVRPAVDDDGNQRYRQLGREETLAKIMDVWQNAQAAQGANGGGDDTDKWISLYRELYGPKPLSPEEQEIQQRQRQNAVEDQRRADNMRGPQQLVRYTDASGRLVTGNGWIRDGKVYDANGYEVQGATPMTARYDAATGETRYEEMPRPEPAAEAQGAQGSYDPALVASDGTIGPTAKAAQENLGAGGQPPAQDGAALLRQMRGGGQPPAQGATQPAQGGAAAQATQRATPQDMQRAVEERRKREAAGQRQAQQTQAQGGAAAQPAQMQAQAAQRKEPEANRTANPPAASEATLEDLWGSGVMARFRKNHPDATDAEIRSGKFDSQLRQIGKALHGDEYLSKSDRNRRSDEIRRFNEEEAARNRKQVAERAEREKSMSDRERATVQKARDLFGDLWEQADDWAVENHGQGLIFKDSYETARAKKFNELVEERARQKGLQLSNLYKSGNDLFGSYNPSAVFDEAFGDGAGTYFGKGHSAQQGRFNRIRKRDS